MLQRGLYVYRVCMRILLFTIVYKSSIVCIVYSMRSTLIVLSLIVYIKNFFSYIVCMKIES